MKRLTLPSLSALLMIIAACGDPMSDPAGDIATFEARNSTLLARLTPEQVNAMRSLIAVGTPMSKFPDKQIDGTQITWGSLSRMSVREVLAVSEAFERAKAEQLMAITVAAEVEQNKLPRLVSQLPSTMEMACVDRTTEEQLAKAFELVNASDARAKEVAPEAAHGASGPADESGSAVDSQGVELSAEVDAARSFIAQEPTTRWSMEIYPGNVNLYPKDGGRSRATFNGEALMYTYFSGSPPKTIEDLLTRSKSGTIQEGRLAQLVPNWNEDQRKYADFFTTLSSGPFYLVKSDPKGERQVVQTYEFALEGTLRGRVQTFSVQCESVELNERGKLAVAAAAEAAEQRRRDDPNERIVDAMAAKGGHCSVQAMHARQALSFAQQYGAWEKFHEALGRAGSYGC